jgi:hypothetical protein
MSSRMTSSATMNFSIRDWIDSRSGKSVSMSRESGVAAIWRSASSLPFEEVMADRAAWPGGSFFMS